MPTPKIEPKIVAFPESDVSLLDAYLRGLPSDATRRVYRRAIRSFCSFLDREALTATRRDVEAYRAHLEELGRAPSTICKHLSALSGFYGFAIDEGVLDRNPAAAARRPRLPDTSPRRALSPDEVRALLAAPDTATVVGLRDRAMLTCLAVQGWRIAEVLGLRVEDLDEEQGHRVATVTGKGSKTMRVPLAAPTWTAITSWLEAASIESGPVFVAVERKGGDEVIPGKALSQQSAWKRLRLLARRAGLRREVSAHLFRHGAITAALDAGVALRDVQDFARHADPRTTRRYDSHRQSLANPTPHVLAARFRDHVSQDIHDQDPVDEG